MISSKDKLVEQKMIEFFYISTNYIGKEIILSSNNIFKIDEINIDNKELDNFKYNIKYGNYNDGFIELFYNYNSTTNSFFISAFLIYIKNANGYDRYDTIYKISNNKEAFNFLDSSVDDLKNANILGDYISNNQDKSIVRLSLSKTKKM